MIDRLYVYRPDNGFREDRGITYTTSINCDPIKFVEEKVSISDTNVLRGFHGDSVTWKLVTCFSGKLKLVVVDRKKESPTFGEVFTTTLSYRDNKHVLIPPGCLNAHHVVEGPATFYYKISQKYSGPENQKTVRWDDPIIRGFPEVNSPCISERDLKGVSVNEVMF
jgi:dTDP-4-dehydrorhamnose 3,5-epimerase